MYKFCRYMKINDVIESYSENDIPKKTMVNIMYTQAVLSERFNELLKSSDLSQEQFNVLRILRGQKGKPANMSTIQERMIAKTSNTTRLIDKLLIKKLVSRQVCESNRRKIDILITESGLDVLSKLDPLVIDFENKLNTILTVEELKLLNKLLTKIRA